MKKIDRREFLKTSAGAALLAMAPAILTGCGDSQTGSKRSGTAADLHMHLMRQETADRLISILKKSDIYGRPIIESNGKLLISHLERLS